MAIYYMIMIILPILIGCLCFLKIGKNDQLRNMIVLCGLIMNLITVLLSLGIQEQGVIFSISQDLSLSYLSDGVGQFFAILCALMWLLVGIYSFEYMMHEHKRYRFYAFYMMTLGAMNGICFAGNYMTMYCFFEFMTLLSMPMVFHNESIEAIKASKKYLIYSVFGATLGLLGFFFLSYYGTSTNFMVQGVLDMSKVAGKENLLLIVAMLSIIGFCAKAGMFPLHAWLPVAHPVAPACASSILSGVITKAGVLAVIRVVYYQFGADFIRGTWVQYVWIVLALVTVFMGSMLAYKEKVFKKRLAYSTVSQVSYILFGLACLSSLSLTGSFLHIVAHSLIKNVLFMSAGATIIYHHAYRIETLDGIGTVMPKTMGCFTIATLGLIGIPPMLGFVSKWYLAQGSISALSSILGYIGPAVLLISALLTAGYLFNIVIHAFFVKKQHEVKEAGYKIVLPMMICCLLIIALGVYPKGLIDVISLMIEGLC